ncbi:MAG TPA: glycosyltransferase family 39 protein [Anaerolineae bacterium]|nr:glycosyltransferase family 39 protein [Anaerolineae bacterium]HNU04464.1 glycosyltransferase family 39 protein [Anaerolineae bacterium]
MSRAPADRYDRADWLALAILLALGVAVRLHSLTVPRVVWGDEPYYLWIGQSLWAGTGLHAMGYSAAHFPLLFPLLAGGLAQITGSLLSASNLIFIASGALLVVPLYALARAIYSPTAAWMVGLTVALYPALATGVLAWGTLTEPIYLLWVGIAIYLLFQALDQQPMRWRDFALLGLALGLAYLTRTEALVFLVAALALLLIGWLLRRAPIGPLLARLAVTVAVFLLVALPYLLTMHSTTGRWSLTGAAGMAFETMTGLSENDPAAFDRATWSLDPASGEVYLFAPSSESESLRSTLLADPVETLRRLYRGALAAGALFFSIKLMPLALALVAALGLFAQPWRPRRLRGELALLASLAAPLSYLLFFVQERYLAGLLLPAMVWVGAGLWMLGLWLAGTAENLWRRPLSAITQRSLLLAPAVVAAALLLTLGPRVSASMQRTHSFQPGHLGAAAELRRLGAPDDAVVMSRYPAIAFHAGTRWAATPAESWPAVLAYAREHSADYLVIDGWEAQLRPQLAFLLDPAQAPPQLQHLATITSGVDPVVIYAFAE